MNWLKDKISSHLISTLKEVKEEQERDIFNFIRLNRYIKIEWKILIFQYEVQPFLHKLLQEDGWKIILNFKTRNYLNWFQLFYLYNDNNNKKKNYFFYYK